MAKKNGVNIMLFVFIMLLFMNLSCSSPTESGNLGVSGITGRNPSCLQWFSDAKLGIFIHWGIYSAGNTTESWAFHNRDVTYNNYMNQLDSFTAVKYDPGYWAELIKKSGARYSVITSKHHDGVALWDTKMNDLSTTKKTPAARDVLTPFISALRTQGIKAGIYFSLLDWSHPDYPGFLKDSSRYKISDDPARWDRYLKFCNGQIEELMNNYKPDLLWFDGDWEHSAKEWNAGKIRESILEISPGTIINGRLAGYGDYATPEQNFPITRPSEKIWELCMTTNNSWGYFKSDTSFKSPYEVITIFADAISMGGNLLLDIGPESDGTIPEKQVEILSELGTWTKKHEEAIFGTLGGMDQGHFYGPSTLSKDSTSLYLFLPGRTSGDIVVKGLDNKIEAVSVVGQGSSLKYRIVGKISWSAVPGLVYISIPEDVQDKYVTVLKLKLDKPLKLYSGKGGL